MGIQNENGEVVMLSILNVFDVLVLRNGIILDDLYFMVMVCCVLYVVFCNVDLIVDQEVV